MQSICALFPNLVMLDLSYCSGLTSECLFLIVEHMTQLEQLHISNSVAMDSLESADGFLSKLQSNCTHLKVLTVTPAQLHLDNDNCSERNMARLSQFSFKIVFT